MCAFSHEMFVHADEQSRRVSAMVGKRGGAVIQTIVHKLIVDLVHDDVIRPRLGLRHSEC